MLYFTSAVHFREIKLPKSRVIARGHIPLDLSDIICRMRIERGTRKKSDLGRFFDRGVINRYFSWAEKNDFVCEW